MALSKIDTTNMIEDVPQSKLDNNINFRNIIINGDMSIAQRGTSTSVSASTITYSLDRFLTRANSNASHTVVQSTDAPTGFQNSLYLTRDSGQTGSLIRLQQAVETKNIVYLRGQKVTLSFYAKKDSGATDSDLSVTLYTGDGTERARAITAYDNEVNAISDTATLTTSWQKFTFTSSTLISDLSQLSIEISYNGVGTAPSNDGYFITGVQLEAGTTASDFEFLPYDVNLERCQRYFIANFQGSAGQAYSSTDGVISLRHPVSLRANASVSQKSGVSITIDIVGGTQNASGYGLAGSGHSAQATAVVVTGLSGRTTNQMLIMANSGTQLSAEL